MKKLFLSLLSVSFLFFACSKDDASPESNSTINTSFTSTIKVDGAGFTPSKDNINILTKYTPASAELSLQSRLFSLTKESMSVMDFEIIQVTIFYPSDQTSITGTYELKDLGTGLSVSGKGSYSNGSKMYIFSSGTVKITDLGKNKFKLEFVDAKAKNDFDSPKVYKTITGYFEGTFTDEKDLEEFIERGADCVEFLIEKGLDLTQSKFNS